MQALERGEADAICVETMSDLKEAEIAVRAAKEGTDLEIIATFTFELTTQGSYRSMMGVSPGVFPGDAAPEKPILVHTNAKGLGACKNLLFVKALQLSKILLRVFYVLGISFTIAGITSKRSPTMAISANCIRGVSGSLSITIIRSQDCIPTRCWICPEIPQAT